MGNVVSLQAQPYCFNLGTTHVQHLDFLCFPAHTETACSQALKLYSQDIADQHGVI